MTHTPPTTNEPADDMAGDGFAVDDAIVDAAGSDDNGDQGSDDAIVVPDSGDAPGAEAPIEAKAEAPAEPEARPRTKPFRKKFTTVRLDPASAARQSRIALFAWDKLGGKDGASAFLNSHDDELGGRPLDLAVASDAGLAAVEEAISARAASGARG
jgi:hypothetical protein